MYKILGIDNIFIEVGNIDEANEYYQKLGFRLKLKLPHLMGALYKIGKEEPGLLLQETKTVSPVRIWVEVRNALEVREKLEKLSIIGKLLETATGLTWEITDKWGNAIGFADYSKNPALARK